MPVTIEYVIIFRSKYGYHKQLQLAMKIIKNINYLILYKNKSIEYDKGKEVLIVYE
jgi:hypothetical protein